ncbi:SDR family NAD(P)-dependent oxidoreductase [Carboxylicivirga marina]|uniref:SDR family NAD(P)-dependent oxidoreductase n=1 Tax=Carboxylicivirga marina TaxID=2800988 RepID=A0ABS1HP11_9BACT|nr:SDR family NAD(P)-dependent oxidoreductase [Carboxylicivirga marina]MBK3519195.1 SDR family NAD(P)-dependent oxidoreductase [Carboxylicivirga marina]
MKRAITYALVTGAGIGLGKAIATELAKKGHNLLLLARPDESLVELSQYLSVQYKINTQCKEVDFTESDAMPSVQQWLKGYTVNILVNNAGIGGSNYFQHENIDNMDAMLKVNIRAMVLLTHMLMENMSKNAPAYILNVASMASCCPIAFKTIYPASKSFVYSFSRSLNEELKPLSISVSVLLPGPIKTNHEITSRINKQGWWVKAGLQNPKNIAEIAVRKMLNQNCVIIPGRINKINWLLLKLLPKGISIPLVSNAVKNEIQLAVV